MITNDIIFNMTQRWRQQIRRELTFKFIFFSSKSTLGCSNDSNISDRCLYLIMTRIENRKQILIKFMNNFHLNEITLTWQTTLVYLKLTKQYSSINFEHLLFQHLYFEINLLKVQFTCRKPLVKAPSRERWALHAFSSNYSKYQDRLWQF